MTINEYKAQYNNSVLWFEEEVKQPWHSRRIANAIANKDYLAGRHKVLRREDVQYKGKMMVTRKTILNYAKTIIRFHNTFLLGKPVQIVSDAATKQTITDIYKVGQYSTVDYQIIDKVNKFGDAYEVVYCDNGIIKSKVLDSGDCYPVYGDLGEYLAFIEHWTDGYSSVAYYNVYYPDHIEHWDNSGGDMMLKKTNVNVIGLPIHYHNFSDEDSNFGISLLTDIKPIMDDLEDIVSKMGDAIYVNSLNPLPVAIGQRIESTIPADVTGFVLNLDNGDFKVVATEMDYNTIKLYLDNMKQMLADISCLPSILASGTEISNVSETSMRLLLHMASVMADENIKWLNAGFQQRFEKFRKILKMQGISIASDVDIVYNIDMPIADSEMINNLKSLQEMGAISKETIMEKSDIISDYAVEKERIESEREL